MKEIYRKMWELAKPYYEKGRPTDMDHIEWMNEHAQAVCDKEDLDESLLIPLVLLHDTGYSEIPKDNPFNLDLRKAHMKAGAKITREILEKLNYPKEKTEKIVYYVSVHDNWAFGETELYKKDKILGVFTDLDFTWMIAPIGFQAMRKHLEKSHKEMIKHIESNEHHVKKKSFSSNTTKEIYEKHLEDRKKEL